MGFNNKTMHDLSKGKSVVAYLPSNRVGKQARVLRFPKFPGGFSFYRESCSKEDREDTFLKKSK